MTASAHPVLRDVRRFAASHLAATLSDRHLLERFASWHDEAAFAALVCRHGPLVLSVCRRVLHDAHAAEDAFQTTFLVLARKAGSLRRPEALGPFLYGVAYRTAHKALARTTRRRETERQAAAMRPAEAPDELAWREVCQVLDDAVLRLPEKYRVPLILHCLQGRTVADVARQLGCPQGTVATRLVRAREQLRGWLARRGVVVSVGALAAVLQEGLASAAVPPALLAGTAPVARIAARETLATGGIWATATALLQGGGKAMFVLPGKVAATLLVVVGMAGGAALLSGPGTSAGGQPARACAEMPAPATPKGDVTLFLDGGSHFLRGNYPGAARAFHRLSTRYPDSPLASKAVELAVLAKAQRQAGEGRDRVRQTLQGLPLLVAERAGPKDYARVFDRVVDVLSASFEVTYANPYDGRIETSGTKVEGAILSAVREQQAAKDFNVAEYYRKTGHPAAAVFHYERVCRRYPATALARQAAERCRELRKKERGHPIPRIAATINGEALLVEEVHAAACLTLAAPGRLTAAERERRIARAWKETLARMIDREVILQDAAARLGSRNNGKILRELQRWAAREFERQWLRPTMRASKYEDVEAFKRFLRENGMPLRQIQRQWERNFMAQEYMRSRVEFLRGRVRGQWEERVRVEYKRIVAELKRRAVIEYPDKEDPQ